MGDEIIIKEPQMGSNKINIGLYGAIIIFLIVVSGLYAPKGINWIIVLGLMLLFFVLLGVAKGKWNRILVDERNQMSLSRFQLILWTLIIVSAYITIALSRIQAGTAANISDALAIALPWQLWALIGISVTSIVGTPLILNNKESETPDVTKLKTTSIFGESSDEIKGILAEENEKIRLENSKKIEGEKVSSIGTVCIRNDPNEAKFIDIFTGDEIADCRYINIAKVQMFFFTLLVVLAYSALLFKLVITTEPEAITSFPELDQGLIAILGISHGAYLTQKAVPSTPTA